MKHLLITALLIPILSFSQVSNWRNSTPQRSFSSPRTFSNNGASTWRNTPPSQFNKPPQTTQPPRTVYPGSPYYMGLSRWDVWGAPAFGWSYWDPYWYYNDWGYRQPGRIYVYENGKRDTVLGKKWINNFGIHKTNNGQIGAYFATGNKAYFIMDFVTSYAPDNSTYYPYGTIDKVDFPLISDLKKQRAIYAGVGTRIGRLGVHTMFGVGSENVYWRGKDAYGEITFPKYNWRFTTLKVGALLDVKRLTLKYDHDPIKNYSQFGLGINF